jgi:hypothetical protein
MSERMPGYYWVDWTELADSELVDRRPGALIGEWDGKVWWFVHMQTYRFDCEVRIRGERLAPPASLTPMRLRRGVA